MGSISSKTAIQQRMEDYWKKENIWKNLSQLSQDLEKIKIFIKQEYEQILEKEKIGKGSVYITTVIASKSPQFLSKLTEKKIIELINKLDQFGEDTDSIHLQNFSIALVGEIYKHNLINLDAAIIFAKKWANHPKWEIREMAGYILRKAIKKEPDLLFKILPKWIESPNENLRRVVVESLRPFAEVKWLRDPSKNGQILDILSQLRADSSVYVRKSVGNNLKDLSKYMPHSILDIVYKWILEAKIQVEPDLASRAKKEIGEFNFNLIWTIKHALRWLNEKHPEFHPRISQILGRNYVEFFDENKKSISTPFGVRNVILMGLYSF